MNYELLLYSADKCNGSWGDYVTELGRIYSQDEVQSTPLPTNVVNQARDLIRVHGRRAAQHLVDQIQSALREGDEAAAIDSDSVLRAVEREIWKLGNKTADAIQVQHAASSDGETQGVWA